MGTLASALSAVGTVASVAQPFIKASQSERQAKQTSALQMAQLQQSVDLQKQQNALLSQQAETARLDALRRAVAKQRASYGAQGVGAVDGSSEAVLLGQFQESDQARQNRAGSDAMKNTALDLSLAQKGQTNLLEQEQQRQKNLLSSIGSLM